MENGYAPNRTRVSFGLPFFSMDFNELTLMIEELANARGSNLIFTASLPWLLDFSKNPLLCPAEADYILATDSNLTAILNKMGIKIKMPLEYFEFPEQIARICAHYGYSMMHVSETGLKSDILVSDGYVPLSWDLFTHFKTSGELDEIDARSIIDSARDSAPNILLLNAPPESLKNYAATIFSSLENCIMICVPQDEERNRVMEKLDNVLGPMLIMFEENDFIEQLKLSTSIALPSSISYNDSSDPASIKITGTLDRQTTSELLRMGNKLLDNGMDIDLDLSDTSAVSLKGIEAIYVLLRMTKQAGKKMSMSRISENIQNTLHRAGLAHFIESFPGIISELD